MKIRKLLPRELPPLLREIPKPPKYLYLEGNLPDPEKFTYLTVVGSRKHSGYGKQAVEKLIAGLAGYPIAIVSGLAVGIDSLAHRAALSAGLPTIAIPGSGLNRKIIYPQGNRPLADEILSAGGALLSEFEPDTKAALYTFPMRNRLMAGISKAVLLVEAGEKSGTLITAKLAIDYNREVMVVPGQIFSPTAFGIHQFLKLGATPVTEATDILTVLGFEVPKEKLSKINPGDLSPEERKIYEILLVESLPRDIIVRELGIDISETNTLLAVMELKGIIREDLGEVYLA